MLSRERDEETRILLLFDALQFGECSTTTKAESTPVSILLTTEVFLLQIFFLTNKLSHYFRVFGSFPSYSIRNFKNLYT